MTPLTLNALSSVIRRLYVASRCSDVERYQRQAMEILSKHIRFDAAWWGRSTCRNGEHRVHCSFPYHLPEDIAERLNHADPNNVVAQRTVTQPHRAHYFGPLDLRSQPGTAALTDHMGIEQSICFAEVDETTGVSCFISLARRSTRSRFSARDLHMLELLCPHLGAALDLALADELTVRRHHERSVLLATDTTGMLRAAEPAAAAVLRVEWPGWTGPSLPKPLVDRIAARQPEFLGQRLHASIVWRGDLVFVSLGERRPRDLLTRRERDVADSFAAGQSYRQVAEALGVAPATVRHHLRSAYVKLGVTDKAAFATRLGAG